MTDIIFVSPPCQTIEGITHVFGVSGDPLRRDEAICAPWRPWTGATREGVTFVCHEAIRHEGSRVVCETCGASAQ